MTQYTLSRHQHIIDRTIEYCKENNVKAATLSRETGYTNANSLLNGRHDYFRMTDKTASVLQMWLHKKEIEEDVLAEKALKKRTASLPTPTANGNGNGIFHGEEHLNSITPQLLQSIGYTDQINTLKAEVSEGSKRIENLTRENERLKTILKTVKTIFNDTITSEI